MKNPFHLFAIATFAAFLSLPTAVLLVAGSVDAGPCAHEEIQRDTVDNLSEIAADIAANRAA